MRLSTEKEVRGGTKKSKVHTKISMGTEKLVVLEKQAHLGEANGENTYTMLVQGSTVGHARGKQPIKMHLYLLMSISKAM